METATITTSGSGTAFNDKMVGSLLRVGDSTTNTPSGLDGIFPFDDERAIVTVASTTSMTLDADISTDRSGVKYCITDRVELDYHLHEAFYACIYKHLAIQRNMKNKGDYVAAYLDAVGRAKGSDNTDRSVEIMGSPRRFCGRLADYPAGDDVE